jgi:hypothetical protein
MSRLYTQSVALPDIAYLIGLGLSTTGDAVVSYTPAFDKNVIAYAASVGYDAAQIVVTPTTDIIGATITVNGAALSGVAGTVNLVVGSNAIVVVVANGTATKTYIVTVTRLNSTFLSAITSSKGTVTPSPVTKVAPFNYTVKAGFTATSTILTLTAEDPSATNTITLLVDSNTYTSTNGTLSQVIAVSTVVKTATVTVSSTAGTPSTVYTIALSK